MFTNLVTVILVATNPNLIFRNNFVFLLHSQKDEL